MEKEGILTSGKRIETQQKTVFKLKLIRQQLVDSHVYGVEDNDDLNIEDNDGYLLDSAKDNLIFVTEKLIPVFKDYFKMTNKRFNLGKTYLSPASGTAIFYDPKLESLAYSFAEYRKPVILSENILNRLYNAEINSTAVETFGELSKIQIIDEVVFTMEHPTLKLIKDSLPKAS